MIISLLIIQYHDVLYTMSLEYDIVLPIMRVEYIIFLFTERWPSGLKRSIGNAV
jgi:hypothetical protein